ncbi:hypothetical protein AB6A40_010443 [Gnathostoma spinigerum]|uniref:Uncharacterized protein n=1 Tax=Gnathostoma spinigerum TaxID=75299 RepID=A0ABD6F1K1_9BILA
MEKSSGEVQSSSESTTSSKKSASASEKCKVPTELPATRKSLSVPTKQSSVSKKTESKSEAELNKKQELAPMFDQNHKISLADEVNEKASQQAPASDQKNNNTTTNKEENTSFKEPPTPCISEDDLDRMYVKIEPEELRWKEIGGLQTIKLTNTSDKRTAIKASNSRKIVSISPILPDGIT